MQLHKVASNGRYARVLHRAILNNADTRMSVVLANGPVLDKEIGPVLELLQNEKPLFRSIKYRDYFQFQYNADFSLFGAILELKLPPNYPKTCALNALKYVTAFRGTLTGAETRSRDILLDLKWIVNTLHKSSRFKLAMHSIQNTIDIAGSDNVWLAGDSLGSAIALLAGKNMSKKGYNLPTYLFNSPFTSAPLERINHQKIRQGIHISIGVMKVGLSAVLKGQHHHDHICSGYINYFAQREKMEKKGEFTVRCFGQKFRTGVSASLSRAKSANYKYGSHVRLQSSTWD
ncbi:hypothetical protein JHK85_011465 [Glycine max]|uniref:GDSL esterase/lipase n=1 Tax=Glycine soja TaxID=3848 RepID=A0A0B2SGT0_GLYSO|nr:hypothetical protein JHK85_011465 [Glycine max]KAG5067417.1 hypothetical protein JHK86_011148 [Glycine max]KHN44210.1 GDSL esterase/lipase [Glycine soja]